MDDIIQLAHACLTVKEIAQRTGYPISVVRAALRHARRHQCIDHLSRLRRRLRAAQAETMRRSGMTYERIADTLGVSTRTVYRYLSR